MLSTAALLLLESRSPRAGSTAERADVDTSVIIPSEHVIFLDDSL
jgi:hypothetical protein